MQFHVVDCNDKPNQFIGTAERGVIHLQRRESRRNDVDILVCGPVISLLFGCKHDYMNDYITFQSTQI